MENEKRFEPPKGFEALYERHFLMDKNEAIKYMETLNVGRVLEIFETLAQTETEKQTVQKVKKSVDQFFQKEVERIEARQKIGVTNDPKHVFRIEERKIFKGYPHLPEFSRDIQNGLFGEIGKPDALAETLAVLKVWQWLKIQIEAAEPAAPFEPAPVMPRQKLVWRGNANTLTRIFGELKRKKMFTETSEAIAAWLIESLEFEGTKKAAHIEKELLKTDLPKREMDAYEAAFDILKEYEPKKA